ncbi:MAG: sulfite exporter TauE/SafE family protein [Ferrovum sp.]|nr:sulfite exporter TauE/SafE family protein [Ferrovum sp.]
MSAILILSGAAGGLLIGMTGVGGGSLMTPLLVLGFGIAPATAIGTDLIYAAVTKAGAVVCHHRQRHVEWRTAGWLLVGSLPGSLLTLWVLRSLPAGSAMDSWLRHGLALALALTALALWLRKSRPVQPDALARSVLWSPALGFLIGILVTLSSVGGGALGTALLLVLYPEFSFSTVVGTELAHAVPLTLIAGLGHLQLGHVDGSLLFSLLLGSLPGLWAGTRLHRLLPEKVARTFLSLLLLGLAVSLGRG